MKMPRGWADVSADDEVMAKRYRPALEKAQADLSALDPMDAAARSGTSYRRLGEGRGEFEVPFWTQTMRVTYPEGEVWEVTPGHTANRRPHISLQLITLHYLITADGSPMADRWVAFRELPDARFYDGAFRLRAIVPLLQHYGEDAPGFVSAALALQGERLTFGDASFMFRLLPRVRMAVVLYLGDEEFPPEGNILYDAAAGHYLPTEDLSVLGEIVSRWLIRGGD